MVIQLQNILIAMWEDNCVIQPISFRRTLINFEDKYQGYMQHDSLEVLSKIIELLHVGLSYKVDVKFEIKIKIVSEIEFKIKTKS